MSTVPGDGGPLHRPAGVLVVEILLYLGAVFQVVAGVLILVVAAVSDTAADLETLETSLAIVFILIGLFNAVLAHAIGQGREWARVVYVLLQLLAVLGGIVTIMQGYPTGVIFFFLPLFLILLLFTPSAERYFETGR